MQTWSCNGISSRALNFNCSGDQQLPMHHSPKTNKNSMLPIRIWKTLGSNSILSSINASGEPYKTLSLDLMWLANLPKKLFVHFFLCLEGKHYHNNCSCLRLNNQIYFSIDGFFRILSKFYLQTCFSVKFQANLINFKNHFEYFSMYRSIFALLVQVWKPHTGKIKELFWNSCITSRSNSTYKAGIRILLQKGSIFASTQQIKQFISPAVALYGL